MATCSFQLCSWHTLRKPRRVAAVAVLFAAFGGCSAGPQSVLDPAGSGARQALEVGEIFTAICLAVYLLVAAVLLQALLRSRQIEGPVNRSDVARLSPAKE